MVQSKQVSEKFQHFDQEFSTEGSLEPVGTDTDSGLSGSIRGDVSKRLVRGTSEGLSEESSSPTCQSPKEEYPPLLPSKMRLPSPTYIDSPPQDGVLETSKMPEMWKIEDQVAPLQFKIEEHIEEITTRHFTDEESYSSDIASDQGPEKNTSEAEIAVSSERPNGQAKYTLRKRRFETKVEPETPRELLPAFDLPSISDESLSNGIRVPFPELGVDLLSETLSNVDGGPSELVLESCDWKENWLFRREKYRRTLRGQCVDSITMLIPNPCSNVMPTIGDRDIDELSELSDRHSIRSFEDSSDEYNQDTSQHLTIRPSNNLLQLVGEINAEFGQQDQEYTEDTTILDRLHLTNGTKSIRTTLATSHPFKNTSHVTGGSPVPKTRHLERVLRPPEHVPHDLDNKSWSSPTVWFESVSTDQMVPTGRTLRLTCQVQAKQFFGLNWYFQNELLYDGKTILTWKRGDTYHLNVFEMTKSKAGLYVMCAYTEEDCVWAKCKVLCRDQERINKTPRFSLALSDACVEVGSDIYFECHVSGHPEPIVTFMKDSVPLLSTEKCFIENDQYGTWSLQLRHVDNEDEGQIRAIASNSQGHTVTSCHLSVGPENQFNDQKISNYNEDAASQELRKKKKFTSISPNNKTRNSKQASASLLSTNSEVLINQLESPSNSQINNANFRHRNRNRTDVSAIGQENMENGNFLQAPKPELGNSCNGFSLSSSYTNHLSGTVDSMFVNERDSHSENYVASISNNLEDHVVMPPRKSIQTSSSVVGSSTLTNDGKNNQYGVGSEPHKLTSLPPMPGTIAEREHRKWLEAKPLANNPYSPEKLAFRLGQMSNRFPSLPTVCRDTSGDEYQDTYLAEGLVSSSSDLSRYSRDYHINRTTMREAQRSLVLPKSFSDVKEIPRSPLCLVKIEPQKSSVDWREELKDIKLDVGKKVADIQKSIDACQHEWERQLRQKGWNTNSKKSFKYPNQKLSSSCINLSTPPKTKYFSSPTKNRHLVYSSTEALNSSKQKELNRNDLWRTVSVDILNSPIKSFSAMTSNVTSNQPINLGQRFDSAESKKSFAVSDSDDSSVIYPSYSVANGGILRPENNSTCLGNHINRRLTSYYSENSIESLREQTDTEESASPCGYNPNLPSVKELASKFDATKNNRQKVPMRKNHEKPLRASRGNDILIINQRDQRECVATPYSAPSYSKKFNDKLSMNEVRNNQSSKHCGSFLSSNDYLNFDFKSKSWEQNEKDCRDLRLSSCSSDVFSPTVKEDFFNSNIKHPYKYRNRFSTSEANKADEYWGTTGLWGLHKIKQLSSSLSSVADSDVSAAGVSLVPECTAKSINEVFGVKLRDGSRANGCRSEKIRSSSSDIFPLNQTLRASEFEESLNISDTEESEGFTAKDPVVARKHNLPRFQASITVKPHISRNRGKLSGSMTDLKVLDEDKPSLQLGRPLSVGRPVLRMYDFIRKYENKKSLNELTNNQSHCNNTSGEICLQRDQLLPPTPVMSTKCQSAKHKTYSTGSSLALIPSVNEDEPEFFSKISQDKLHNPNFNSEPDLTTHNKDHISNVFKAPVNQSRNNSGTTNGSTTIMFENSPLTVNRKNVSEAGVQCVYEFVPNSEKKQTDNISIQKSHISNSTVDQAALENKRNKFTQTMTNVCNFKGLHFSPESDHHNLHSATSKQNSDKMKNDESNRKVSSSSQSTCCVMHKGVQTTPLIKPDNRRKINIRENIWLYDDSDKSDFNKCLHLHKNPDVLSRKQVRNFGSTNDLLGQDKKKEYDSLPHHFRKKSENNFKNGGIFDSQNSACSNRFSSTEHNRPYSKYKGEDRCTTTRCVFKKIENNCGINHISKIDSENINLNSDERMDGSMFESSCKPNHSEHRKDNFSSLLMKVIQESENQKLKKKNICTFSRASMSGESGIDCSSSSSIKSNSCEELDGKEVSLNMAKKIIKPTGVFNASASAKDYRDNNKFCARKNAMTGWHQRRTQILDNSGQVHHSLTARSVSKSFREGLRMHTRKAQPALETLTDESIRFVNQECQSTERDTESPEHLGIPSSPAAIPTRHQYPYPSPGDTSDDSMGANMSPRKNYRKRNSGNSSSRPIRAFHNSDSKGDPYFID